MENNQNRPSSKPAEKNDAQKREERQSQNERQAPEKDKSGKSSW